MVDKGLARKTHHGTLSCELRRTDTRLNWLPHSLIGVLLDWVEQQLSAM